MVQKQPPSADPVVESKKRRRVGFSPADAGVEANECIKIYLASSKEEVGSPEISCLNPVDLNSFFDEEGKIYGYQGLKINVWINSISFCAYADITYQSASNGAKGVTDLKSALQKIFGETLVDSKDEFLQTFSTERDFMRKIVSRGEILQLKAINGSTDRLNNISGVPPSDLEVVRMSIDSSNAGLLYSRLVPLVLLFIDGSSPIDVTDPDWQLYLLIHKKEEKEECLYRLVGFSAVYRFYRYPDRSRMRLSQILVLPTCQQKGYGSFLVEAVNNVAVAENFYDLTVEEPSENFQHIRTCIDINRLIGFDPIKPAIDSAVQTLTQGKISKKAQVPRFIPPPSAIEKVRESLKINKKQFLNCWEILIYLALDPIDKYMEDYTMIIANHVRADVLGKDLETPGKQVVDVTSSYDPESSFVMFKSLGGGGETGSNIQTEKNQTDQEQQLKELVEERIREIKLVAEKVSPR
ncbi:PREDICTED: histone acetyltransferase type B catalytic subunit [Tarenaya hassleriana]|uniref:histone acetyltransferase type B catalytic subunit n=1 Tax=Tarenaya hassleriana TaxID=28532 RepID=UPI00053C53DF|nr:PREDICTED: histone acetyltransferase type B catalytic subunit [Tarenaya hassleriana]